MATILQKFECELAPNHPVVAEQLLTLRAKHGMKMVIKERQPMKAMCVDD